MQSDMLLLQRIFIAVNNIHTLLLQVILARTKGNCYLNTECFALSSLHQTCRAPLLSFEGVLSNLPGEAMGMASLASVASK